MSIRRVLFAAHTCYLDDSNGASVASRAMMEALAQSGFSVEAISGIGLELDHETDFHAWLAERGFDFETCGETWALDGRGLRASIPPHCRLIVSGVPVTLYLSGSARAHEPGIAEQEDFLRLYQCVLDRFQPEVVVNYGGNRLARRIRAAAQARGSPVVFTLHNFSYDRAEPFETANAVIVPSQFAADYYRKIIGINCNCISNFVNFERARTRDRDPSYVTFVNPSYEKGVFIFAKIAEELGRKRPDIPLLVVEGRGSEQTLADCGVELRNYGNVFLMSHTPNPKDFWGLTRICLLPSLWWENQPLVAIEAMVNGIPVIGSDRGGIPEALGNSGIVLPLPDRLTPATRQWPTTVEIAPWIDAIIRLWDDQDFLKEHERRALNEARRWEPEILRPKLAGFFARLQTTEGPWASFIPERAEHVATTVYQDELSGECDRALRQLESAGVRVERLGNRVNRDSAYNEILSNVLRDGRQSVFIVDPNIRFDHRDILRLMARPEPVIVGIAREQNGSGEKVEFVRGVEDVHFGRGSAGMYPLKQAGAEFLRIRGDTLRRMVALLNLPLCETGYCNHIWPFFQPIVVTREDGSFHYLEAVPAFFHRLQEIGITPLADTSVSISFVGKASPWARPATVWSQIPGMFDFAAVYDAAVAAAPRKAVFVEIGCLAGRSTCYLGTKIRESGKAITLYAIDSGRGSSSDSTGQSIAPAVGGSLTGILHRNLIGCEVEEVVVPIITTSTQAALLFQPESVDFCFIDADHSYESVMGDLKAWWPKVKRGGTLAGHDYRQLAPWLQGVTSAVHNFFQVPEADHPLCSSCWAMKKP